jgi:hypothetical protein
MRFTRNRQLFALGCLILLTGCGPQFGMPSLCEPGSASSKLAAAKKFDPYPDPSIGPPVVGGRPLGFQTPRAEPDATKRPFPVSQSYPPPVTSYAQPASYYPSSNVIAPPATAAPAAVAYPPVTVSPSAATRVAPPITTIAPNSTTTGQAPLVPLDYSKMQSNTPNPASSDFKTTAWPPNSSTGAFGTKITGP